MKANNSGTPEYPLDLAKLRTGKSNSLKIIEHTKIFASMCPDEILDYYDNYQTRTYYTTLMLGDVSGFTDLTEKYTKSGKGGPSKLTETLNNYIGAMVQEILSHKGDVLKFSGDAFIVMWKLADNMVMRDVAVEAIQTACVIQKYFGTVETDVDVTLKVKLAIASGKTYFTSIGDPKNMSYYIITGNPVWDVKKAQDLCRGGDILVTPSCWRWVNPNEYVYEMLPDGKHTLVFATTMMWDHTKHTYSDVEDSSENNVQSGSSSGKSLEEKEKNKYLREMSNQFFVKTDFEDTNYSLRPKVIKAAKHHLRDKLRSYMLRPVIRAVEIGEPLHYLTEMRQVVIVFVNVITKYSDKKKLIQLVNNAYLSVCNIVGAMQGCVNKTSLFDKDLMFLCIFGLKGERHNLESQIALRCGNQIRTELMVNKNITSVTVGVTTGICYCGVVGHILRREYTVIGMPVNKAARLMCAYTDKVVCDRESFLQSHLDAKHFVLQVPKILKGITNVGPVYEFVEEAMHTGMDKIETKYPILGRDVEIRIFNKMLSNMLETRKVRVEKKKARSIYNTLFIKSESRMGKTRYLYELTQIIPKNVPVNFISLKSKHHQEPYSLIRMIFSVPLGFVTNSTLSERQDKLSGYLWKYDQPQHFCALNQIFNVEFNIYPRYTEMSLREKRKILRRILVMLMYKCFRVLWVVMVDDAEYTDENSLSILKLLARQDLVLFVLSFGQKRTIDYELLSIIPKRSQVVCLLGLDKWYHVGLACQILNVEGIPAEIEKIIQEKSLGNPGWIESYLISLIQVEGIVIKQITKEESDKLGLVLPLSNMLKRTTNFTPESTKRDDAWDMYQSSYRDSKTDVTKFSKSDEEDQSESINVCLLSPDHALENFDTEATIDVIILKIFDSLSLLEQFLLKCASVLGEIINRNILEHALMLGTPSRSVALAVKKLFELQILGCAMGNFNRNVGFVAVENNVQKFDFEKYVGCGCVGIEIKEHLSDLPKYASCGLMRFRMSVFREATYKLLTEFQKVEFHTKALNYLQENVKRCAACGRKPFRKLLGETSVMTNQGRQRFYTSHDIGVESLISLRIRLSSDSDDFDHFLKAKKNIPSTTSIESFSQVDFRNCECNLILMTTYTQILEHCFRIERSDKALSAILEFAEVCLSTYNILQARKLLKDGEELLTKIHKAYDNDYIIMPYIKAKFQILQGRCYLVSGHTKDAQRLFANALQILNYTFPSNRIVIKLKSTLFFKMQTLNCFGKCRRNRDSDLDDNSYDQLALCLSQMFILFRVNYMKNHAILAAAWALHISKAASKDFVILCTTYSNMIIALTIYDQKFKTAIAKLENDALNICHERHYNLELQEVKAIAKLYSSIFLSRWLRGLMVGATKIGFITARLAHTVRSITIQLNVLQGLIHLLLVECRYSEVISFVKELEFIAYADVDKSGRVWYYALCMDIVLESGIAVIPVQKCEQFYQEEKHALINIRDIEAEKRYFTCMWLWYVRMGEWESAANWKSKLKSINILPKENSVAAAVTSLKQLESLMIYYVYKINCRNVQAMNDALSEIKATFKIIKSMKKAIKVVCAEYFLFKAYYEMIHSRTRSGFKLLEKSKKIASEMNNKLIYEWALHCEKAWKNSVSSAHKDLWLERCSKAPIVWQDVDILETLVFPYTLPLPKNV